MHELGIATEIYRICRARIPAGERARLERVSVRVGELSAVEPDLLRFAWDALTADGPDAGAALDIEWRAARQVCDTCGTAAERPARGWIMACPRCGRPLRIEGGDELDVLQFSYAPAAAPEGSPA